VKSQTEAHCQEEDKLLKKHQDQNQ